MIDLSKISAPEATIIAALIALSGTLLGFVLGAITTTLNYRQKQDDLFFGALQFLRGGSQNRNLGIAGIQLYWDTRRRRSLCVALLVGSAIYLLLASKQGSAAHEINNLNRIMDMLLNNTDLAKEQKPHYQALRDALTTKLNPKHLGGLTISEDQLNTWLTNCQAIIGKLERTASVPVRA
jgi:hypothetical protein